MAQQGLTTSTDVVAGRMTSDPGTEQDLRAFTSSGMSSGVGALLVVVAIAAWWYFGD
jgi:hypothetical protein